MQFKIFIICQSFFCLFLCYNNFNELKKDMEKKVESIALAVEEILQKKCEVTQFDCPNLSFNICQGTGVRSCLPHFPTSKTCNGQSKYSLTSGIRIPSSSISFDLSDQTEFNLCKTAESSFQAKFQQLIDKNEKNYAWLNFGFSDGSHRVSPGFKYEKEETSESCKDYDPRLRPWYSANVYTRKKMIILIQNSLRMHEYSTRNHTIKLSLQALLKTGEDGDFFNVIEFSDKPRCLITPNSDKQVKLVSLIEQTSTYNKRTGTQGKYYEALSNNLTNSASSQVNYTAALQMATNILKNSMNDNVQYENFILMFAGFSPTNYTFGTDKDPLEEYLSQKQKQLNMNLIFFSFGIDMVETEGKQLLKNLSCKFDGIFFQLSNLKYESMFVDQARGFYEYLSQGNELRGYRWTPFYEDAFGLGRMTTVVRGAYYQEKNVTRLIGLAGIDVLVSQLTVYKSEAQIRSQVSVTQRPFKKNISLCALETIRRKNRCYTSQQSQCDSYEFCQPKLKPDIKTVMRSADDISDDACCPYEQSTQVGLIVGVTIGALMGVLLIALLVYCCICRQPHNSKLQETYMEIFSKFKDFEQTRIRADSQTSLIKQ